MVSDFVEPTVKSGTEVEIVFWIRRVATQAHTQVLPPPQPLLSGDHCTPLCVRPQRPSGQSACSGLSQVVETVKSHFS